MGYLLASETSLLALVVLTTSLIVARLTECLFSTRVVKQGEVLFNEMRVRVSERAAYKTFVVTSITISFIIPVTLWSTYFNTYIVPYVYYMGLGRLQSDRKMRVENRLREFKSKT
ncbi:MAG: hypothetical protein QXO98_04780 [Sulfolobales archaeon]